MILQIKALSPKIGDAIPAPHFATPGSAAMDLCACLDGDVTLKAGARQVLPTGIAIALPSADYVALICARSGLASKHGITMANGVGASTATTAASCGWPFTTSPTPTTSSTTATASPS